MKTFEDTLFEPNHIKRFSEISMSKGEIKTKFGDLIKQLQELVLHLFDNNNVAEISCKISSVYNSDNDEWIDGIVLPDGEFSKLNLKNLTELLKQRRKILPCKIKFNDDKGVKMKEPVVNGYIKFLHPKTDKINEPNMPWENKSEKKSIVKKFDEFVNELLNSDKFFDYGDLESTFFVIYKSEIHLFNYKSENYVEKVRRFCNFLIDDGVVFKSGRSVNMASNITDFDSANSFFERYLNHPKVVAGHFYDNSFNSKIPKDVTIAEFYKNDYRDIRISDVFKKLMTKIPDLKYFEIEGEIYHKDELLKRFGKNYNKQTKLPDKIYHGTTSQYIENILKEGLKTNSDKSVWRVKNKKYIFFTTSFKSAEFYSNMSANLRQDNGFHDQIILEINSDRIDKDKIVFDFDFYSDFVGKGNDEYNKMLKSLQKPPTGEELSYTKLSNKNKGGEFGKFGYEGIVLPTKINKIHFKEYNGWKEFTIPEFKEFMKTTKMK
jgi:hypothetical protein